MTTDDASSGQVLVISPPFVNLESLLSQEAEFHTDVIEVPLQGSSGPLHNRCAPLQTDVHIFWKIDSLVAENGLHSHSRCSKKDIELF